MPWELGFLSPLYNVLKDIVSLGYKRFGPQAPVEVLEHRTRWKAEFANKLNLLYGQDLIIRDLNRMDSYPDINSRSKGISSWFKAEFKDLYHRGFEVFLNVVTVKYLEAEEGWVFCDFRDEGAVNALVVGFVPYDVVRGVDWSGDEFYRFPHIYCDFTGLKRKEPYEKIELYRRHKGVDYEWFEFLSNHEDVRKLSTGTLR